MKIHLLKQWQFAGKLINGTLCGNKYTIANTTDKPEEVTCKICLSVMKGK